MKEQGVYREVQLAEIGVNPWNPPGRYRPGREFDELVESVRQQGVIQPVVLRPLPGGPRTEERDGSPTHGRVVPFEVVAGERRFRAACAVAAQNGGIEAYRIPAVVRGLSDDQAFEITVVENLQRKDLSELEEAEGFRAYLQRKGAESLSELAERTGINPQYIRRRVKILDLPGEVLEMWDKGRLRYGHLEQLSRLGDRKRIRTMARNVVEWRGIPVSQLRGIIDRESLLLSWARFDTDEAGCPSCHRNTDVQKNLFGLDGPDARCLDCACFKRHQNEWFLSNWKRTGYYRKYHTSGFRFDENVPWNQRYTFYGTDPPGECRQCPDFVTIIGLEGKAQVDRACVGSSTCFQNATRPAKSSGGGAEGRPGGPRVAWHGQYFREKFFKEQLPLRFGAVPPDDAKSLRAALFSLLLCNTDIHRWFALRQGIAPDGNDPEDSGSYFSLGSADLWPALEAMDREQVLEALREAAAETITSEGKGSPDARGLVARHLGIDLAREFTITEEYLNKKTISELLQLGECLGIFEEPKAKAFLYEVLLKKRGAFKRCKKSELKRVFLESGVDLVGRVPAEVLGETTEEPE